MKRKHLSIAIPSKVHDEAFNHLIRDDGQEDLCFSLWYPSYGQTRETALINRIILPRDVERKVHGNASFSPSYFDRVLGEALKEGAGIAFMHSHLGPGWQGMSMDDIDAELSHAASTLAATDLPLVGLTLGTDGSWSARFWQKVAPREYDKIWCESVRVVGKAMVLTFDNRQLPPPEFKEALTRTISSWGPECQADLMRLKIGIIGTGSVGCMVAEALARTGITHIKLLDYDRVETINLDRLLHATREDVGRPKVEMLADALRKSATAKEFQVDALQWSIVEEAGFRDALDCDILFSCVDRPWPRYVLNFIAYAHLIPVIDGGIFVGTKRNKKIRCANWKSHIVGPGRACLECLEQYTPSLVSEEKEGRLDDPRYIETLEEDHPLKRNENVFAFSMSLAAFEVLQMLSMVITPAGEPDMGQKNYHFVLGELATNHSNCKATCWFPRFIAKGDKAELKVTGRHTAAEQARSIKSQPSFFIIIKNFLRKLYHH